MVDFQKNTKIELKYKTWKKKTSFDYFTKSQKLNSFTWKINYVCIVITKPQQVKSNTWK